MALQRRGRSEGGHRRPQGCQGSCQSGDDRGSEAKCFAAAIRCWLVASTVLKNCQSSWSVVFADAVANVVAEMQSQGHVHPLWRGFCRTGSAGLWSGVYCSRIGQNGPDSDLIDALLQPHDDRWLEYAVAPVEKKTPKGRSHAFSINDRIDDLDHAEYDEFDEAPSADERREAWQREQKERGRLARFLARRGFSGAVASRAIKIGLSNRQESND